MFIVNFILGCRFCGRSCSSLMSPHGYFQNMKQSSKYLFHDLVKGFFMSLPYFLPIISYRFSSKYTWVRVAYVGAIFVLIAVPNVWIELMLLNWKELLLRIISIPSMIKFLLNLGCNVSKCLSIQYEMACFANSWGMLLYRFVASNVAMSVLGSIFSGMELKKDLCCR